MTEISFEDLVTGLRGWARGRTMHEQAAVELLIWHETWLRRPDFKGECITQRAAGLIAIIHWEEGREFIDRGYAQWGSAGRPLPASSSERRILDLAVALGENQFGLSGLGYAHKRAAAQAFAAAVGLQLEPAIPEVGHNHPDFISGDATCQACELPTWPEIENHALTHLDAARNEMSEVRDWLRSDWRPLGSPLTDAQADARDGVLRITGEVKDLIDQAKGMLQREAPDA